MTDLQAETWYELKSSCPAVPLTTDGNELAETEELSPGLELMLVEERGDRLLMKSRSSTPAQEWRYLLRREDFEMALTAPGTLPRGGQAPTSSEAGAPA